jgi:hypothetical protein
MEVVTIMNYQVGDIITTFDDGEIVNTANASVSSKSIIVITLFGVLWSIGIVCVIWLYYRYKFNGDHKVTPEPVRVDNSKLLEDFVLQYFPKMYSCSTPLWKRIIAEMKHKHKYFAILCRPTTAKEAKQRILMIFQLFTILAILYCCVAVILDIDVSYHVIVCIYRE